uniref:Alternative protein UNC13C n=1 Tax=Homo sapiens TaxID=9606 RepID=L8E9P5_HUMAN|nr:alternative protein UNC13C [Homo sapiens]
MSQVPHLTLMSTRSPITIKQRMRKIILNQWLTMKQIMLKSWNKSLLN